jgi:hypothetical protein
MVESGGWRCCCIAPIGRKAKSRGWCVIVVVVFVGFDKRRQHRSHSAVIDLIVERQLCVFGGGVVVFDARQFVLVLVIVVRQSVAEFVEGKGGLKLPTNTSSKTSASAARSTGILFADDPVERLNRVGATIALARSRRIGPADAMVIAVAVGQNTIQNTTFS